MYPMKMKPVYKDYLWGGTKLNEQFNKNSKFLKTAESWELSCCQDGMSIITNGFFKDTTLYDVLKKNPDFVCNDFDEKTKFPLLIKLIDANDKLSIQVHPSDKTADKCRGQQGKAEMWYILDCKENAFLYIGLKNNISEQTLKTKISSGDICDCLNKVFVKTGDVFFISPGLIHAIGEGVLIAEIQQSSNTTFRMFDYNRVDSNGKKRELHVDDAVRVCDKNKYLINSSDFRKFELENGAKQKKLVDCEYFKVSEYISEKQCNLISKSDSFQTLLFIDGSAEIFFGGQQYEARKGDCYFIPAGMGEYEIKGAGKFLLSEV